jgi:hypothetical protein
VLGKDAGTNGERRKAIERYADDNERIFRAVIAQAQVLNSKSVEWLVDASKSVYRLMWLAGSDRFNLRVIHLMKDPRAFAHSMSRRKSGLRRALSAMRATIRWQAQNRQFDALIRNHLRPEQALRLRYEELASNPVGTMESICQWVGIPFDPDIPARFREGNHGIAGNPSRAESKPIQLDDRWRRELPASLARIGFLINGSLARRYGYIP